MLVPFRVTLNEEPDDEVTLVFDCMAEDADHAAEQAEDAYPGCTVLNCTEQDGTDKVRVRLTLDVAYDLNGVDAGAMRDRLYRMCVCAIGDGMLTGETDATVDAYSIDAALVEKPLTEEEVAKFMQQRIENGQLHPEDIAVRLARYGLTEVPAFVAEMRERMETAEQG